MTEKFLEWKMFINVMSMELLFFACVRDDTCLCFLIECILVSSLHAYALTIHKSMTGCSLFLSFCSKTSTRHQWTFNSSENKIVLLACKWKPYDDRTNPIWRIHCFQTFPFYSLPSHFLFILSDTNFLVVSHSTTTSLSLRWVHKYV